MPIWQKPITLDLKTFFKALAHAGADAVTGQWIGLGKDAIEVISAVSLAHDQPEELAWTLICVALTNAVDELLSETHLAYEQIASRLDALSVQLETALAQQHLEITERFFEDLAYLEIVAELQKELRQWLEETGLDVSQAVAISGRVPTYFVFALHREWQRRPDRYALIYAHIDTPFAAACAEQHRWVLYNAWLQKQIEEPMVLSSLSLKDVYVPLRAYYTRETRGQQQEKVAVDLARSLNQWILEENPKDAVRVISGGPGSGKSSFAKIFAAHHASKNTFPVLFIPLHQLNFEQGKSFQTCINDFVHYTFLKQSPLEPENENMRLLIILDGLDELADQGAQANVTVQAFLKEMSRVVKLFNLHNARLQIILTGREITVQAFFKGVGKTLHTLPYVVVNKAQQQGAANPYVDTENILEIDQRDQWWQRYGAMTNTRYSGIPDRMQYPELTDITSQPLLNYLVALSYLQGKLSALTKTTNLNKIYADLLEAVYERDYDDQGKHSTVSEMSQQDFLHILEMIALSAWHAHKHSATISEVEALCHHHNAKQLLDIFQGSAIAGITQFLASFYFRQSERSSGERTFEFTHKSFREYLVARRIVSAMEEIQTGLTSDRSDSRWNEQDALLYWARVCGPAEIDGYLLNFVRNEIALRTVGELRQLQATFIHLIDTMLRQSMPMEKLTSPTDFATRSLWARNSEEALLLVLNACAIITQTVSVIRWPNADSFSTWLKRLQSQKKHREGSITAASGLSFLDLSGASLDCCDLNGANLERTNLSGAHLYRSSLEGANLRKANLTAANLQKASLDCACLDGATLDEAVLENASLDSASLIQASLIVADLHCAHLKGASLKQASLNGASLDGANLMGTNLRQAQLEQANFAGAQLEGTDLERACLNEANLEGVCLDSASCIEAQFHKALLDGASCKGTIMVRANLSDAILDGATFDGTNFYQANLNGASLKLTSLQSTQLVYASLCHTILEGADVAAANFTNISWDEQTQFFNLSGLERAVEIPAFLMS